MVVLHEKLKFSPLPYKTAFNSQSIFVKMHIMLGRILDYASINHFSSFMTVTIETVKQAFLQNGSCQNMNLRKMVNRCIVQYLPKVMCIFTKNRYLFKAVLQGGGRISGIKFAGRERINFHLAVEDL